VLTRVLQFQELLSPSGWKHSFDSGSLSDIPFHNKLGCGRRVVCSIVSLDYTER
jgi:hypothetical protein